MLTWTIICNILAIYAFLQIIINKVVIKKHDEKRKYIHNVQKGGDKNLFDKEKESLTYSKTTTSKLIEKLKFIF